MISATEAAKRLGVSPQYVAAQCARDIKKPLHMRRFPSAKKCQCGAGWLINENDI